MRTASPGSWVVTGAGLMSAAGENPDALLSALVEGRALASVRSEDCIPTAAMSGFDAARYIRRKGVKDLSRTSQLVCAAAAGNADGIRDVPVASVGVVLGSAWGCLTTVVEFERQAHVQGPRFVDPILFTETVSNVPAGQVAILYGWSAFNATVSAGSASGTAGLQRALEFLQEGRGSVAVAGGGDELNIAILRTLAARGAVAARLDSLPLVAGRCGPIGGEGACFLTLEAREHAQQRGAAAWAEIRAAAVRFSPRAEPHARQESMAELIRSLLSAAELTARDVDVVVISANGDLAGDREEAGAVVDVFGEGPATPSVVVPKAVLGETWGASGPLAAAAALAMIRSSTIPGAPRDLRFSAEIRNLNIPSETLRQPVRIVMLLDRAAAGHQLGLILSAGEQRASS